VRSLVLALIFAGCAADVCDGFDSCLELTVEPAGAQLVIDELQVDSSELEIADKSSFPKKPIALPVRLAVVAPAGWEGGSFSMLVRGLRNQQSLGEDRLAGKLPLGAHVAVTAFLGPDAPNRDAGEVAPEDASAGDAASPDLQSPGGIFPANRGLDGVTAHAIAVDPQNPDIVYVGTEGEGVFRSIDGGKSWSAANAGIDRESIGHIAIAPSPTTTLYASSKKLFKSLDSGATWSQILDGNVTGIAVDPVDSNRVFVTLGNDQMMKPGGVLLSIDGGHNFAHIEVGLQATDVTALAMDPTNHNVLWCGGQMQTDAFAGRFLARSDNGGSSWTRITATNLTQRVSSPFRIHIDSQTPTTLYVSDFSNVVVSTDDGATFNLIPSAPSFSGILTSAISSDGTLYVASASALFTLARGASTFNNVSTDRMQQIAIAPSRPQRVYVNPPGTLRVSDDGAGSFTEGIIGFTNADVLEIRVGAGVILAGSETGLHRSTDGAASWTLIDRGLVRALDVSRDGRIVWASVDGVLRRSSDGGGHFNTVTSANAPVFVSLLLIDPSDSKRVYLVGNDMGKIKFLRSDDDGVSFLDLSAALPPSSIPIIADPNASNVLWEGPTQKSANDGTSWSASMPMFTPPFVSNGRMAIDPANSSTLYLAGGGQIYRSTDGGSTWNAVRTGLGDKDVPNLVATGPSGRVYIMAYSGNDSLVYRSDDGVSWRFLGQFAPINDLAVDPSDPDTFYFGTFGGPGLFKSVTGGL
jgi:photosystem II stability/assembly factor-like uncharacterized protein